MYHLTSATLNFKFTHTQVHFIDLSEIVLSVKAFIIVIS